MVRYGRTMLAALCMLSMLAGTALGSMVGGPLPDFTIRTLDGEDISQVQLKGQPALVVFWNTWCAVCMHELPRIDRLSKTLQPGELKILAINSAINDSEKKTRAYAEKQGFGFSIAFDRYFEVGQAFGLRGVPTIFLVDPQGMVRAQFSQLPDDLEKQIKQISKPVSP